jgi:hypothetical protein
LNFCVAGPGGLDGVVASALAGYSAHRRCGGGRGTGKKQPQRFSHDFARFARRVVGELLQPIPESLREHDALFGETR